jgi:hypothetical protein
MDQNNVHTALYYAYILYYTIVNASRWTKSLQFIFVAETTKLFAFNFIKETSLYNTQYTVLLHFISSLLVLHYTIYTYYTIHYKINQNC